MRLVIERATSRGSSRGGALAVAGVEEALAVAGGRGHFTALSSDVFAVCGIN